MQFGDFEIKTLTATFKDQDVNEIKAFSSKLLNFLFTLSPFLFRAVHIGLTIPLKVATKLPEPAVG